MLRNFIKIALRHIRKNRGFSALNIFGLALGLACAILILLWIQDEMSYDKFNEKYDRLYRVMENQHYEGKTYTFGATPGLLAQSLREEMPEVINAARTGWGERRLFALNDKPIYEDGNYVDPQLFDMLSFDFLYGNRENPLPDEHSIVITERMSEKLFGKANPVGRYLKMNNKQDFVVTAVIGTPPVNSSFQFDWLASFKIFEQRNSWWNQWGTNGVQTYVELREGVDYTVFNKKFVGYLESKTEDANAEPLLHPMPDWRLRSNFEEGKQMGGRIEYVRLFGVIAILIVLIACINFMNLATARSEQRAKEVGVRKVMGAQRRTLMLQFIGESIVMAFFATLLGCLLVAIFLPAFNSLVEKELTLGFERPAQWIVLLVVTLSCGMIAGSYPAVFLSSFRPIAIFKGLRQSKKSGAVLARKGLVVTQFVVSIVLIISTVVIYKQIQHVKNRHLGYNKENLLYVTQQGKINENIEIIEQDLLATGVVAHAATCNQPLLQLGNNTGGFSWDGKDPSKEVLVTTEYVSPDYINTIGLKLSVGRNFYTDGLSDSSNVLINETFAKLMGKTDPVGSIVRQDTDQYNVVGVVKDFVFNNMYTKPDPLIIFCSPHSTNFYFIRLKENTDAETALKKVGEVFKKDNPGHPFEYYFVDQAFERQFRSEMLISKLSRLFAVLTIVISCLGLFGLAAYTAERRTREIGIRKILGATISNIVLLLSGDFIRLVLISVAIASPLAWCFMKNWLHDYPYRINIAWWMFALAGSLATLIAVFTVSLQTIKAARANPVNSIRTE